MLLKKTMPWRWIALALYLGAVVAVILGSITGFCAWFVETSAVVGALIWLVIAVRFLRRLL
jgi:hypothetical protein